jgi:hypothetical protein
MRDVLGRLLRDRWPARLGVGAGLVAAGLACTTTTQVTPEQFHLPPGGDPASGLTTFVNLGCTYCHQVEGREDLPAPSVAPAVPVVLGRPAPSRATDARLVTAIINPSHDISQAWRSGVTGPGGHSRMGNFHEVLTVRQLMDLVAFLREPTAAPAVGAPAGPASGPASRPATAPETTPADALGRRLAAAVGDPYAASEIRFDFVVLQGGQEKLRRRHVWRPKDGTAEVRVGELVMRVDDLANHQPPADPKGLEARAYAAWVNDVFWLLAPAKVMDPGVRRAVEADGRLTITFEGVGLTPGDQYTFTADPKTGQVSRWDFVLQDGTVGAYRWEDHQRFGPLTLSTRRPAVDGSRELRLENISVVE